MKSDKTLVLGASMKPNRYSNLAIRRLLQHGHSVEAIGREIGEVDGVKILTEKKSMLGIDTVTLYLNPVHQEDYYDYILQLKPKRVIFNPGTENPEFYKLLEPEGIHVEVACTLVMLATNQY